MRHWSLALLVLLGPALGACQAQPGGGAGAGVGGGDRAARDAAGARSAQLSAPADPGPTPLLVERLGRDIRDVERFHNTPWSEDRWVRLDALHESWRDALDAIDFDALDTSGRIDWLLMANHLQSRADRVALDRARLDEIRPLLPFREAIIAMEVARWRIEPVDARATAATLGEIAEQVKAIRGRVKKAGDEPAADAEHDSAAEEASEDDSAIRIAPAAALRAAGAVSGLRRTLETTMGDYINHKPGFDWWVGAPREEAVKALRDYENYLRRDLAGIKGEDDDPLVGDPIGREALLADLRAEMIAYTPEELIAIAERELAWRQEEMVRAAREMGFGDDWKAALDQVKSQAVDPGEQDLYVAEVAREAIEFLKAGDMVTIPPLCEELWRAEMIPANRQGMFPFAYYSGLHMGIAYPTDEMSHEDKLASMRGNNRHFTRNVVPHELIPGHHLQSFMAARYNPHRSQFRTPFLVEGWALYWEMEFWDAGWAKSPEDRMGILFWGMHRCARIIVSLKYHLGEMPAEDMIDFLIDEIGHERFGATSEVRRYIGGSYSPLYQVAYMIGGLQFRALREEIVDTGMMSEREFHDTILTYGSIPIDLIRAGMLELELHREWGAEWPFAGEIELTPVEGEAVGVGTGF